MRKTLSWLRPTTLAATVIAAGSFLAPLPVHAQDVTVLRGSPSRPSPSQPYASVDCNNPDDYQYCQDNQSSNYSPSSYGDDYPYYGDDFPVGAGGRRFSRRGGFHGKSNGTFQGGGFHAGFHGGGFQGGGGHR
jgi:hypothetical protein